VPDPIALPGFGYSPGRALAIADAVSAAVAHARIPDVSVTDVLAGLAEVAAREIAARPLRRDAGKAARAVAAYIVAAVDARPILP
jgi:hypothetical protein